MPNEGTNSIWVPFATGVLGALLGGLIQYYATRSLETEKQLLQTQLSAYADFAKAEAQYVQLPLSPEPAAQNAEERAREPNKKQNASEPKTNHYEIEVKKEQHEVDIKIRDASFRIIIFSPAEVVKALAAFVKERRPKTSCWTTDTDVAIYQSMRRHALGSKAGEIDNADIARVLFGCGVMIAPSRPPER